MKEQIYSGLSWLAFVVGAAVCVYFFGFLITWSIASILIILLLFLYIRGMVVTEVKDYQSVGNMMLMSLTNICKNTVSEIRTMDTWAEINNSEIRFSYTMGIIISKMLNEISDKEESGLLQKGSVTEFVDMAEQFFTPTKIVHKSDIIDSTGNLLINSQSDFSVMIVTNQTS